MTFVKITIALCLFFLFPAPLEGACQEIREREITKLTSVLRQEHLRERGPERVIKAIERLGEMKATEAIDDLIQLLTFRRTFSWERDDGIVVEIQPITPANRYPAVSALFQIGKPALPALVTIIEINEIDSVESRNAIYAVQGIFRDNLAQGVSYLRKHATKSFTPLMSTRLQAAADGMEALARKLEKSLD